jgi:hypothetical protein
MYIKDLYTKIPVDSTFRIASKSQVNRSMTTGLEKKKKKDDPKTITNQNYFQYEGKYYQPQTGVAMGSPISGDMAEIIIQELEQNKL